MSAYPRPGNHGGLSRPGTARATLVVAAVAVCAVALSAAGSIAATAGNGGAAQAGALPGPGPDPALGPQDVVRIQLEALRGNDAGDEGIAAAFRFASPGNRASTGPVARFARMIKAGPYRLMLKYRAVDFEPVEVRGDRARQRVTLIGVEGSMTYEFYLSRQPAPECPGRCWMTDAVTAVPVPGLPA